MTFSPANSLAFKVVENVTFSKDQGQFLLQLTDLYQKLATSTNAKDIGDYETVELLNGQQYFGANPQTKHQIYRKVIECGALKNIGTTTVAHGISTINSSWMFTRVYGMARYPGAAGLLPNFIPLPNATAYECSVMVDNTNVNITTAVDLSAYTYSIVILEYWKSS